MKQQKTKILTLTLASVLAAAALCGGSLVAAAADEQTETTRTPYTYTASQVFGTTNASIVVDNTENVGFSIANEGSFTLSQRDLAWRWFKGANEVGYLHFTLAFADVKFSEVVVTLETDMALANEDKKAINTITFTQEGGEVYAAINKKEGDAIGVKVAVAPDADGERPFTISLNQDGTLGSEYNVVLTDKDGAITQLGKFTNVGASYGEFASSSATTPLTPFKVSAKVPDADNDTETTERSVVKVVDINGQSFKLNADKKIEDTAAPVLVVNDEITSLTFGSVFSVDYDCVDVLDKDVSKTVEYAQYNPTVSDADMTYRVLTSTLHFTPTPYKEDDGTEKTVYSNVEEFGVDTDGDGVNDMAREFVSIIITLSDESFKGDFKTAYDLSWYAAESVKFGEKHYIVLDENMQGPAYAFLDKVNGENVVNDLAPNTTGVQNSAAVLKYQGFVEAAATDLKASSKTNFYLPSLSDLIKDDAGYANLSFTISYKSTNSSSASTRASVSASNLYFPVAKSGTYRFKVFAVDKAGNSMEYYDEDGKLVKVEAGNVWEIEEIPYFEFTIAETALSVEEQSGKSSNRKGSVAIGKTFSDFSPKILGDNPSEVTTEAKLYRIDLDTFNQRFPDKNLSLATLASISYKEIAEAARTAKDTDSYLKVYAELLATVLGVSVDDLLANDVFVEIEPYNDKIDAELHPEEYNKNNVYEWNAEKQTFKPLNETDVYFIIAVYTDEMLPSAKACAYMVVSIDQKNDVLPGESDWLKNNIASVILFSIAGVMLILIVVLLLIKPSDETLEDVDEKAKAKEKKAKPTKK